MTELAIQRFCVVLRSGLELWVDVNEAKVVSKFLLDRNSGQFFDFRGSPINKSDFLGVFTAEQIGDMHHYRRGDWQCDKLIWHPKEEACDCWQYEQ